MSDWNDIDTVVCDIDGVVLIDREPVPGSRRALEQVAASGRRLMFVTNNSTKTLEAIATRIFDVVGFAASPDQVMNSGWATGRFIADKVDAVYVLGTDGLRKTLRSAGVAVTTSWAEADAVVAGLDFDLTYRKLVEASLAVQSGATFYATNRDPTYPTPEGLYPGTGTLVSVIETTTGVVAIPCGKPHHPMQLAIAGMVGARPLIIGDRPETDIAFGKAQGWATALVLGGVTSDPKDISPDHEPDVVLESIAALPGMLR